MDKQHIKEVFSDEAFVKSLFELETPSEVQAALKGKSIDMTEAEIIELRDEIVRQAEKAQNGEELSLEQLDEAAGGVVGVFVASIAAAAFGAGGIGLIVSGGIIGIVAMRRW